MQQTGKLHSVGEVKTFDSGFMIQEFFLDLTRYNELTGEKYLNHAKFQIANEKVDLSQFSKGDIVKVDFSIRGSKYAKQDGSEGFAQNLNVYKMELVKQGQDVTGANQDTDLEEQDDDLPF